MLWERRKEALYLMVFVSRENQVVWSLVQGLAEYVLSHNLMMVNFLFSLPLSPLVYTHFSFIHAGPLLSSTVFWCVIIQHTRMAELSSLAFVKVDFFIRFFFCFLSSDFHSFSLVWSTQQVESLSSNKNDSYDVCLKTRSVLGRREKSYKFEEDV